MNASLPGIAAIILLAGLTIVFVLATATIPSYAAYAGGSISVVILVALFVTLIPTTIGALLSAIGIAGMDRLVRFNVLAMSGRSVEAAGDQVADQDDRRERGDDLEHEHHRVLHQGARVELDEGGRDGWSHDLGIEQGRNRHAFADV